MQLLPGNRLEGWLGGEDLGAAGRAPVHAVGQASHLRVPALAGVAADDIGQSDYPVERLEERSAEEASARFAVDRAVSEGPELVHLAERADERMRPGSGDVFHLSPLGSILHR